MVSKVECTQPLGHDVWLNGLWRAAATGRLPHALLLTGASGIGKFTAARWFAVGLVCEAGPGTPCLQCGPCRRFMAGTHPDYMEVDAREHGLDALTVAFFAPRREARTSGYQGPSVGEFLSLRSAEGGARVVLVREAERMNASAQNAFLKTLEEPSDGTILVMESSQPGVLLPTILSRLVAVNVGAPSPSEASKVLTAKGLEGDAIPELVRLAKGSPGLALLYAEQHRPAMRDILVGVAEGRIQAIEARIQIMDLPGKFEGKTPAAGLRARARCFLDLALEWIQDGERHAAGVPAAELAHGDRTTIWAGVSPLARREAMWSLMQVRQDVSLNLGAESLLDRALLALHKAVHAADTKAPKKQPNRTS